MKTIGLIGCGNWGSNILRDLLRLQCSVYVVDIDPLARSRASDNGALDVFCAADQLPGCDGYVVAVPIPDLARESAGLLRFKRPVFAEKTLCTSLEDYSMLNELGGSEYIFAMHKWHYHPGIERLRIVAQSDRLGEIETLSITRHAWVDDFHGGDVFWTQAVHDFTIVKHILGSIPRNVRAIHVVNDESGIPVSFSALTGDQPSILWSVSGRHCHKISGVSIHGKKGSAGLHDAYDDHITVHDPCGEEKISIDTTFPLFLELKEFIAYLSGGPEPRCNLQSAKEVTAAILWLRKSAGIANK